MITASVPDTAPGVPMEPEEISIALGLDYIPPELWNDIDKTFVEAFRVVIGAVANAVQDPTATPTAARIRALSTSPDAQVYFRKGGRVEYALDLVLGFTKEQSPLGDGEWDEFVTEDVAEGGRQEWVDLPICANDLNFDLARAQIGLPKTLRGPYFPSWL